MTSLNKALALCFFIFVLAAPQIAIAEPSLNEIAQKQREGEGDAQTRRPAKQRRVGTEPEFTVYFEFDSKSITAMAHAVLADAVEKIWKGGPNDRPLTKIKVVGHSDRYFAPAYAQALSEGRVYAVKAQLVTLGVPEDIVATEARGSSQLIVQTAPGVKEPRNRRVEIFFEYAAGEEWDGRARGGYQ